MNWDEAVEEAKEELGYGSGYLQPHEWEEVVETAKEILSQEREEEWDDNYISHVNFYQSYLKTPVWAEKRLQRLKIDNNQCQDCGDQAEHVHHITYDNLGHEDLADLVSLCYKCHGVRHGK